MKKIFLFGIVVLLAIFVTSCGSKSVAMENQNVSEDQNFSLLSKKQSKLKANGLELNGDIQEIISEVTAAYKDGVYKGIGIFANGHVLSVDKEGTIWFDNTPYTNINYNINHIGRAVNKCVFRDNNGSYMITYRGVLELWKNGELQKEYTGKIFSPWTVFYPKNSTYIFTKTGAEFGVLNLENGVWSLISNQVIDVCVRNDGMYYSNFEHQAFRLNYINPLEKELVARNVIYFYKEQSYITEPDSKMERIYNIVKTAYDNGWDGRFCNISDLDSSIRGDVFVSIDYHNRIIVNNQNTGIYITFSKPIVVKYKGANFSDDLENVVAYADKGKYTISIKGKDEYTVTIPETTLGYEILWISPIYKENKKNEVCGCDTAIVAYNRYNTKKVFVVHQDFETMVNSINVYSPYALDASVAYENMYFIRPDSKVMVVHNWQDKNSREEYFLKYAYALNRFNDEAQGAIVPEQNANYSGYGYSNLYSSYGNTD